MGIASFLSSPLLALGFGTFLALAESSSGSSACFALAVCGLLATLLGTRATD